MKVFLKVAAGISVIGLIIYGIKTHLDERRIFE